jgi:hypothetical protein
VTRGCGVMWQGRHEGEPEQVPQDGGEAGGSVGGDDDGSEAAVPDDGQRVSAVPRHQRERLRDEEQGTAAGSRRVAVAALVWGDCVQCRAVGERLWRSFRLGKCILGWGARE